MKKYLLLFTSAALLLVGCAKEQLSNGVAGELTNVTFTANLDNGVVTKALADGDGAAAYVNRCIMEIYYGDTFYKRLVESVTTTDQGKKVATFANVPVVAGKQYTVLFWADCGNEDKTDKYYKTNGPDSLKAVTVIGTAFKGALEAGKNDELDAFYLGDKYTITQGGVSKDVTLKRPFAQLNVITTDVAANKAVISEGLLPDAVAVKYKAANIINVATGEVSGNVDYEYLADVYGVTSDWNAVKSRGELTLSMDYVLAAADKGAIDVEFKIKNGEDYVLTHNLTNLPYQRNYRTNVKGDLLTVGGTWTATIDANWTTPDYNVPFYVASSIQDAQEYIGTSSEQVKSKAVDLSKAAISQDDVNSDGTIHFILKTTSPKDLVNFTLPAIPTTIQNCGGWTIEYENNYPTENVGVNAPGGTKVKILAPTSHVNVTGTSYTEITALTGDNTLVIPQGVTVSSLIIKKGAVEIHGIVTNLTVDPAPIADTDPVQYEKVVFRECEGLSATVFAKIYSETEPVCNYIDPWYTYEKVGEVYNIFKRPVVAMIGNVEYKSLSDAVAAVPSGNTELVTIKVMSDVVINADALAINKNNVVLDGQGHTIAIDETDTSLNKYLVGGDSKTYGSFRMIKVSGNDVTLKNLTLDCKNYRGVSLATTTGGKNASYENIIYKGKGSGHYYGSAANEGTLTFKDCTFETCGYAIHTGNGAPDLVITNCDINGWVSYGSSTKSATITNCHFFSATDQYNGTLATIRPYCNSTITGCTFSKEFLEKTDYTGITVRDAATVEFKGCLVDNGEIVDMANITEPDDPWIDGGVMAIDATGNATDGFSAGTFVAKQASDIKAAHGFRIVAVEGKTNVWTTAPVEYKTTLLRGEEVFGQYETIADAVWAFNYDETITAGDYTLNIKPGTYNEDMILFIQDKTESKIRTLQVQSADLNQKVLVKSTSANKVVFGIAAESDYSGGAISFKNIDFDVTENTNSETCVIYFAGSQSGKEELIFPEPSTNLNRRYAHEVSFDNCNFVGNGKTTNVFRAPNGSSASKITINNCNAEKIGYFAQGYFVDNTSHNWNALHIEGCVVNSQKCFINRNNNGHTEYIKDCDVTGSNDYIFRTDGGKTTIINSKFKNIATSVKDPHTGILVFRGTTALSIDNESTFDKGSACEYDIYCEKGGAVTLNGTTEIPIGGGHNFTD